MLLNLPEKINKVEILNCNNNCIFCGIRKRKNLTTEEIKNLIAQDKKDNDILHFGNGEVAIRKDFIELINYAKQFGYQIIQIETNGRIFYYPQFVKNIKDVGIDRFIIKFYSHKKEIHDKITQTLGSFEQTIIGIKNLVKNYKYVAIDLLINQYNYQEILEIIEFLANLKVNQIKLLAEENFEADILKEIERARGICKNYGILLDTECLPQKLKPLVKLTKKEKIIASKINFLLKQNIKFVDFKMRQQIFDKIKLIDILKFLRNSFGVIFHSSYNKFEKLVPHQSEAIYHHGNYLAVYAQDDPYEAILRALKNKSNKKLGFCASKKIKKSDGKYNYKFFAEKVIRENFSHGFIHILNSQGFFYNCHEYWSFFNEIPLLIFEVCKKDFPYKIEPYPFLETKRKNNSLFEDYERDLIREICLNKYEIFKYDKIHSFEHVYRVSEIAFYLALKECPEYANEVFIGACLHDIGRLFNNKNHAQIGRKKAEIIIKRYFNEYFNVDVLKAIEQHSNAKVSNNSVIGCIFDADRLDLFRIKKIPKIEFLSTKNAKELLKRILKSHSNIQEIFDNWDLHLDYFYKFFDFDTRENKFIFDQGNKFFKKVGKEKFANLATLINKNYSNLGELLEIYKYTKHSCNKIHLFIFSNKKIIVKFTNCKDKEIKFENYLIELLKNKVNLPQILKTKTNQLFLNYEKQRVVLSEFIESREVNLDTLEADVISLLKFVYDKRKLIAKMYRKLLPQEYKNKTKFNFEKDLDFIKDDSLKKFLKSNSELIQEVYLSDNFVPAFKGLQIVGGEKGNYFLGTEHLFELYLPVYQVIVNYVVNIIYLTEKNNYKDFVKKFLMALNLKPIKKQLNFVSLFLLVQYVSFLKNKKLEDNRLVKIWENIVYSIIKKK